ncbi:MAG: methyltransferase domain-containing protein [Acidimicrobiales bacterium]
MTDRFASNFFGPHSPYLAHPLLTPARTAVEVDWLELVLDPGPGGHILDIGCGFGRHSLELARRGYQVEGIDPSETMITAARSAAGQLTARFLVRSGADLTAENAFDGAVCMFTTLGQIETGLSDNRRLLERASAALRPGARLVVEVPQRDGAVAALVEAESFGEGRNRTEITRSYDPETSCLTERFVVTSCGVRRHFDLRYRLFSAEELVGLLADAGFIDIALAADLEALAGSSVPDLDRAGSTMVAAAIAGP